MVYYHNAKYNVMPWFYIFNLGMVEHTTTWFLKFNIFVSYFKIIIKGEKRKCNRI